MKYKKSLVVLIVSLLTLVPTYLVLATDNITFKSNIQIPSRTSSAEILMSYDTRPIAQYVKLVYDYGMSVIGIAAAIALMLGGLTWLTAGGSAQKVSQAKDWIIGAITGLALALTSYSLLYIINPNLVNLRITDVEPIGPEVLGCCQLDDTSLNSTPEECYRWLLTREIVEEKPAKTLAVDHISSYFFLDKVPNFEQCVTPVCCNLIFNNQQSSLWWTSLEKCEMAQNAPQTRVKSATYAEQGALPTICENENIERLICEGRDWGDNCGDAYGTWPSRYINGDQRCNCYNNEPVLGVQDNRYGPCGSKEGSSCQPGNTCYSSGKDTGGTQCVSGFTCCRSQ